jgi:hypothetical protein
MAITFFPVFGLLLFSESALVVEQVCALEAMNLLSDPVRAKMGCRTTVKGSGIRRKMASGAKGDAKRHETHAREAELRHGWRDIAHSRRNSTNRLHPGG